MFAVVQFPFADLRSMVPDHCGRTDRPDWLSENTSGFVRGFGKVAPRNAGGLGLAGEQKLADMNNALVFPGLPDLRELGSRKDSMTCLWYRRLYYDGVMAGRFEIGFILLDHDIGGKASAAPPVDAQDLAGLLLRARVEVRSPDSSEVSTSLGTCGQALALAYIVASTKHALTTVHPPAETLDRYFFVGDPTVYFRVSADRPVQVTRDRRVLSQDGEPLLFLTSSRGSDGRGNVVVQASTGSVWQEPTQERIIRILINHMTSVAFAYDRLLFAAPELEKSTSRIQLRKAVAAAAKRLCEVEADGKEGREAEVAAAMQVYGKAFTGQIDRITSRLEQLTAEWNEPTWREKFGNAFSSIRDSVIKAAVDKGIDYASKGGGP